MRAVLCHDYADPPRFALAELPSPTPAAGEVLVDVHAAAVSFMDLLMAQGRYQMRPPLPYTPGSDAAGVVRAVGAGVTHLQPGDRVACGGWTGAWAEQMLAPATQVTPLPAGVDFETACTVRYAYGTAHYALVERARLQPGETVFVSGAAGGVGLAAVDLAHHLGARVIAGVSTSERSEVARSRGADAVVAYAEEDLKARIAALTDGQGVDVCFDNVGGDVFATMSRLMAWGGRLLTIGFTSGAIPSLAANLPLLKNYSLVGAFWGAWAMRHPEASARADAQLMQLVAEGRLRPQVAAALPLAQFDDALTQLRDRRVQGRIVLRLR
ncbi:NADPH:quinone oxidoreductase family protein [Roseateles sp. NT4]|uniref:NADPH:quinone oxidoreductase family protein n=1 Tax=Roseateles sp. NT4 TaxID=3453715 RepID=UPI003EED1F94